jgi:hypothetical protein
VDAAPKTRADEAVAECAAGGSARRSAARSTGRRVLLSTGRTETRQPADRSRRRSRPRRVAPPSIAENAPVASGCGARRLLPHCTNRSTSRRRNGPRRSPWRRRRGRRCSRAHIWRAATSPSPSGRSPLAEALAVPPPQLASAVPPRSPAHCVLVPWGDVTAHRPPMDREMTTVLREAV